MKFISAIILLLGMIAAIRAANESSIIRQVTEPHSADTYEVSRFTISRNSLPVELLVFAPNRVGSFPVLVFLHGFMLSAASYSQLLTNISARGFITVAPQLTNNPFDFSAERNIREAAQVIEWLPDHLAPSVPPHLAGVSPNVAKLVIMGHSKGGKASFGLALRKDSNITLPLSALVAMDPVDGTSMMQTDPKILTFKGPDQFHLPFPTLIIGTNLGSRRQSLTLPPCAPEKYGHKNFYKESSPPAFNFMPMDYGHMDFLDDRLRAADEIMVLMCRRGWPRKPMREFTGKLVADFLDAVLFNKTHAFNAALKYPSAASITIASPRSKGHV